MTDKKNIFIAVLLVSALASFFLFSRTENEMRQLNPTGRDKIQFPAAIDTSESKSSEVPPTHTVRILKDEMDPRELVVKVGESVQFNSADGRTHNIGQGDGRDPDLGRPHDHPQGALESGKFNEDEGYVVTFTKPGVYSFHDHLDPDLFITIIAYDGEAK